MIFVHLKPMISLAIMKKFIMAFVYVDIKLKKLQIPIYIIEIKILKYKKL
ncbi:hypothetical protein CLLI_25890 [Clostridium liquoris]|jgi:hypothetical protein|uniref:Uncharacterized protein n=1 Tax=Clostridium liquoris TaxID=1289519 RepID=A0A2T0B0I4_9CLOT|nr:hypothetical protein CLLI_25890 [Clostridium liquoris]